MATTEDGRRLPFSILQEIYEAYFWWEFFWLLLNFGSKAVIWENLNVKLPGQTQTGFSTLLAWFTCLWYLLSSDVGRAYRNLSIGWNINLQFQHLKEWNVSLNHFIVVGFSSDAKNIFCANISRRMASFRWAITLSLRSTFISKDSRHNRDTSDD